MWGLSIPISHSARQFILRNQLTISELKRTGRIDEALHNDKWKSIYLYLNPQ